MMMGNDIEIGLSMTRVTRPVGSNRSSWPPPRRRDDVGLAERHLSDSRDRRDQYARPVDPFVDNASRASLRVREMVRRNGDMSAFAFEKGLLVRGRRSVPAIVVGSDNAIHIVEYHARHSAVCSYNRVLRFDRLDVDDTATGGIIVLGMSFYMGQMPVAEKVARRFPFAAHELANYVVQLAKTPETVKLVEKMASSARANGVPADAHDVRPFI